MRKLLLLALLPAACFGGSLTQTTAEIQSAIDNASGIAILNGGLTFTNSFSTTPVIVAPAAGFVEAFAGSTDFTVNTNGTITCNFAGSIMGHIGGSLSSSQNGRTVTLHFYDAAVDLNKGAIRSISATGASAFGSFYGGLGAQTVTNGSVLAVYGSVESNTPDIEFHDYELVVQRID